MKKFLFAMLITIATIGTCAAKAHNKTSFIKSKSISLKAPSSLSYSFTDGCGTTWTITASCADCTQTDLNNAITAWEAEYKSGTGSDGQPCYDDGNIEEV